MDFFSGFFGLIKQGGPIMAILIVMSIVAIAIVIERLVFFAREHTDSSALLRTIASKLDDRNLPAAADACAKQRGMLPRILYPGLVHGGKERREGQEFLQIYLTENVNQLERNLGIIGTIAVIAPFVGLLGTVLGIIHAFQDIALKGNSSPAVVAAGVGEALVTTAAGLLVAVVSVVFFNYFKTRIKAINQDLTIGADKLVEMLHFYKVEQKIPGDLISTDGSAQLVATTGAR